MRRCASNPPTQCKLPIPSWDLVQRANHVAPAVLHHHQLLTLPVVRCRWASLHVCIKHLDEWTFLAFLPREICNPRWWGGIQQTGVYGFQVLTKWKANSFEANQFVSAAWGKLGSTNFSVPKLYARVCCATFLYYYGNQMGIALCFFSHCTSSFSKLCKTSNSCQLVLKYGHFQFYSSFMNTLILVA